MENLNSLMGTEMGKWLLFLGIPMMTIAVMITFLRVVNATNKTSKLNIGFHSDAEEYQQLMDNAIRWWPAIRSTPSVWFSLFYLLGIIAGDIGVGLFVVGPLTNNPMFGVIISIVLVVIDTGAWIVTFSNQKIISWVKAIIITSALTTGISSYMNGTYMKSSIDLNTGSYDIERVNYESDKQRLNLEIEALTKKKIAQEGLLEDAILEVKKEQGNGGCKRECRRKQGIADAIETKADKYKVELDKARTNLRTVTSKSNQMKEQGKSVNIESVEYVRYIPFVLLVLGLAYYFVMLAAAKDFWQKWTANIQRAAQTIKFEAGGNEELIRVLSGHTESVQRAAMKKQSFSLEDYEEKPAPSTQQVRPTSIDHDKIYRLFDKGWVEKADGKNLSINDLYEAYLASIKSDPDSNRYMTKAKFIRIADDACRHIDGVTIDGNKILGWQRKIIA